MKPGDLAIALVVGIAVIAGIAAQGGAWTRPVSAMLGGAFGIETPRLDDQAMIRRGAAHYERVCAGCHASPDRPDRAAALELSPRPPRLHVRLHDWTREMLFVTVRDGVPGTGMPAWPVRTRDDEVWAMVAFLTVLPGMNAATYRDLTGLAVAPADAPLPLASCIQCHGADGRGHPGGAFPRLDIQSPEYLLATLAAFRDGRRDSGFMQSAVAGLRDEELAELARYYGQSVPAAPDGAPPTTDSSRQPACTACHGALAPARPDFPSLSGQYEAYLSLQLKLFASEQRGGGPFVGLMHEVTRSLEDADIGELAAWYSDRTVAQ